MNNKPYLVFYGPVNTFSGYGAKTRDIVLALIKSEKYDIDIISCPWGSTPSDFLNPENPDHKLILDRIIPGQLMRQPQIFMMSTIPSEMQQVGKFNILFTSGIETSICDPSWLEGCNRADLILVSSEHAKQVFQTSMFEQRDKQTNQIVKHIKLEKPIEVLFEGLNNDIYKKIDGSLNYNSDKVEEINEILDSIDEPFNYLFVGHWMQGVIGEDRKDVGMLIKTFLQTFKGKPKQPGLILKTSAAGYSIMDREEILDRINNIRKMVGDDGTLPNIYLLHGELTDEEINELYNHPKVKAHVSFSKGEGFGRPLLEASVSQKPVIAPGWSGQLDFLDKDMSVLLPGQLTQIHPSAVVQNMLIPESQWFTVDYKAASQTLEDVYKNYSRYLDGAKRQAYRSRTNFSLEKMGEKLLNILDEKAPKPIKLKLPSLKRIELPKLKVAE
jgi:glycosyltransferase involved in cell wall biosynthesis